MQRGTQFIGYRAIELLNEQLDKGVDKDGKKYSYSTKPFAIPYDRRLKGQKPLEKDGLIRPFKSKSGALWIVVTKGYAWWREFNRRQSNTDFLNWTGAMLRALTVIRSSDTEVVVGFNDPMQSQKSFWFNVSGVGKSRKLWLFMGLTAESEQKLADEFAASLDISTDKLTMSGA